MLSLKVKVVDDKINFVISIGGQNVKTPLLQFVWPIMGLNELKLMIAGKDVKDQNEEGVFVEMKNKVLNIQLHRGESEEDRIEINLPHALIADEKVFGPMLDAYEAFGSDQGAQDYDYDEEGVKCADCGEDIRDCTCGQSDE